jgi:hypothetical protein
VIECCDANGECRQGRDCPARVAAIKARRPKICLVSGKLCDGLERCGRLVCISGDDAHATRQTSDLALRAMLDEIGEDQTDYRALAVLLLAMMAVTCVSVLAIVAGARWLASVMA